MYWTEQNGRIILLTVPATPDYGKTQGEEEELESCPCQFDCKSLIYPRQIIF